jgi:hypothetical protein
MSRLFNRKSAAVATVIALIAAAGAYAYWTQTGSGTGSASTGSTAAITVNDLSDISGLYPGGEQELNGDFDNPNDSVIMVASVTVSIASVTDSLGAAITGCSTADYEIRDVIATVGVEIAASTNGTGAWSGPSIAMLNSGTDQDACKGAFVHLAFATA